MNQANAKMQYVSILPAYVTGMLLSRAGLFYASGAVIIIEALFLYILCYRETNSLVNLKGLFSLSWIGGVGVACLQLSKLQTDWEMVTWLCFFLAYLCFVLGYDLVIWKKGTAASIPFVPSERNAGKILHCIQLLMVLSILCFAAEVIIRGFVPLFAPEPHAYSYFPVTGVHYFTISCILIPALTVLYCKSNDRWETKKWLLLGAANLTAAVIPILCVSRFQLLFAVGFGAVLYLMLYRKITWKMVVILFVILIPMYVLLTMARRHDIEYLNSIFEMKYRKMPIFITQPYIYVANNFENFNRMVKQLEVHSYGLRMLFPFFALTGLKFLFPQVTAQPIFITKTELTTLTVFYDAYYDFGILGIILLAVLLGGIAALFTRWVRQSRNPITHLFYGQLAIYFGLSFFTTWFSNPTTWFWLAITTMMYLYKHDAERGSKGKWKSEVIRKSM